MIVKKINNGIKRLLHKCVTILTNILNAFSPVFATKILHFYMTGKWLNLSDPVEFNEKLQWLKLYNDNELLSTCADKYELHTYVKRVGDQRILNKIIAVYNNTDEIDWDQLPEKFALKCTHGCGYNIVTRNKAGLDKNKAFKKLNSWLKDKCGKNYLEPHYDRIKPRIILEEFIENKDGEFPLDYKIYCFNGTAKLVLVCSNRENQLKLDFYDLSWNKLHIGHEKDENQKGFVPPICFDEMVKHSEILAKPFPFVRVDFYDKDGEPILGELTFTPAANMAKYYNDYGQKFLGDLLKFPKRRNIESI